MQKFIITTKKKKKKPLHITWEIVRYILYVSIGWIYDYLNWIKQVKWNFEVQLELDKKFVAFLNPNKSYVCITFKSERVICMLLNLVGLLGPIFILSGQSNCSLQQSIHVCGRGINLNELMTHGCWIVYDMAPVRESSSLVCIISNKDPSP